MCKNGHVSVDMQDMVKDGVIEIKIKEICHLKIRVAKIV
jgi:hypothetical protein